MDKSPSKLRIDSSMKKLSAAGNNSPRKLSAEGSRATKMTTVDAQLTKLNVTLKRLDGEFDDCEMQIVATLRSREFLIERMCLLIETLESTMVFYEYAENARKKVEDTRDAVSFDLRDPNLDSKREQELQETIENLAEVQEDLGKTIHGVELSHIKCVQFESQLNTLKLANESFHRRLCEKLVKIERSRQDALVEYCRLLETKRAIENEDCHET